MRCPGSVGAAPTSWCCTRTVPTTRARHTLTESNDLAACSRRRRRAVPGSCVRTGQLCYADAGRGRAPRRDDAQCFTRHLRCITRAAASKVGVDALPILEPSARPVRLCRQATRSKPVRVMLVMVAMPAPSGARDVAVQPRSPSARVLGRSRCEPPGGHRAARAPLLARRGRGDTGRLR